MTRSGNRRWERGEGRRSGYWLAQYAYISANLRKATREHVRS